MGSVFGYYGYYIVYILALLLCLAEQSQLLPARMLLMIKTYDFFFVIVLPKKT